jgi:hypothetical protein
MNILYYNHIGETFEVESDLDRLLETPGFIFKDKFWNDVNFLSEPSGSYLLIINHGTDFNIIEKFLNKNKLLIDDLSNDKSKLILTSTESSVNNIGISEFHSFKNEIDDFSKCHNISINNIVQMDTTKIVGVDKNKNYLFHNRWMIKLSNLTNNKIYRNLFNKSRNFRRKYHFYTINSLPRYHRVELYLFLRDNNLLSKTNGTFFTSVHEGKEPFDDIGKNAYSIPKEKIQLYDKYENVLGEIEKEIPLGGLGRDIKIIDSVDPAILLNFSRSYNSYFNIVTPTIFFNDVDIDKNHIFFEEKFWKPFIIFQPFLIIGSPYTLQTLKEFGFKTFSPFIDESYDTELDYFIRRDKIQQEILRLCSMSIEELDDWYWNMKNILIHNFNRLKTYGKEENNKFINMLKEQWLHTQSIL